MKRDRIVGLIIFVVGVIFAVMTALITTPMTKGDPGPKLFPYIGSFGLIICGVGIFLQNMDKSAKPFLEKEGWIKIGELFALFILYIIGMKYIGFLISTPIVLYIITALFAEKKKVSVLKKCIFSIVITASVYLVFEKLLLVMLPAGILF